MTDITLPTDALVMSVGTSRNNARARVKRWLILGATGILLTVVGVILNSSRSTAGSAFAVVGCLGPLITMFAFFLLLITLPYALRRTETLDLHVDGYVLRDATTKTPKRAATWSQVEDIVRPNKMEVDGMAGAFGAAGLPGIVVGALFGAALNESIRKENATNVIIKVPGKSSFTVDSRFEDVFQTVGKMQELAVAAWEQEANAALDADKSYPIGKFMVSKAGIALKNKFAAWDVVRDVIWFDAGQIVTLQVSYDEAGKKNPQSFASPVGMRGEVLINLARKFGKVAPKKYDLNKPI